MKDSFGEQERKKRLQELGEDHEKKERQRITGYAILIAITIALIATGGYVLTAGLLGVGIGLMAGGGGALLMLVIGIMLGSKKELLKNLSTTLVEGLISSAAVGLVSLGIVSVVLGKAAIATLAGFAVGGAAFGIGFGVVLAIGLLYLAVTAATKPVLTVSTLPKPGPSLAASPRWPDAKPKVVPNPSVGPEKGTRQAAKPTGSTPKQ